MENANGCDTPMEARIDLSSERGLIEALYPEAIGSIMYLMVGTRPDLAFSVSNFPNTWKKQRSSDGVH